MTMFVPKAKRKRARRQQRALYGARASLKVIEQVLAKKVKP